MKKKEALIHFEENYFKKYLDESLLNLDEYYEIHKEKLSEAFIKSFIQICTKIREKQLKGEKGEIEFINYSILRTNIINGIYKYSILAYDNKWYFDLNECMVEYDVSWAFNFFNIFLEFLKDKSIYYLNTILEPDVEIMALKTVDLYNKSIVKLARDIMPEAIKVKEYQEIEKEESVEIRVGEYKSISEVVYNDVRQEKDVIDEK
jgi:hypothetical protein